MEKNNSKLKSLLVRDNHPLWLSLSLHLLPGILSVLVYIPLAKYFWEINLPTMFALLIVMVIVLIPFELGLVLYLSKGKSDKSQKSGGWMRFVSVIKNTKKNTRKTTIILSLVALFWIVFIMGFVDKELGVSTWIYENWFQWLPEYFDLASSYNNPEQYSTGVLVLLLVFTLIVGAIIGPFVEEIYFRGYLMPRLAKNTWMAPLLGAVFFASYHLWTPWMMPIRVLGLLPMLILVWIKKDVRIAIYSHIALNIMGDVILIIPVFFF